MRRMGTTVSQGPGWEQASLIPRYPAVTVKGWSVRRVQGMVSLGGTGETTYKAAPSSLDSAGQDSTEGFSHQLQHRPAGVLLGG